MKNKGRKVDLSNINIREIESWLLNNKNTNSILKCQSILALSRNAKMQEVCSVFGVTRESVRQWKKQLRKGGLTELLKKGKVGKRSKLNTIRLRKLSQVIKQSPENCGLKGKKWTGKLIRTYACEKWKIKISIRTAYQWLNKAKQ